MKLLNHKRFRRCVGAMACAMIVSQSLGCATMAHRSSMSNTPVRRTADCNGVGEVCPWVAGDTLLLFAGVLPGLIAFAVDYSTGAWNHNNIGYESNDENHGKLVRH